MRLSKTGDGSTHRRAILISQGEPSGIGPEIAAKAFARLDGNIAGRPLRIAGSPAVLEATAARLNLNRPSLGEAIIETGQPVNAEPGRPSARNAESVTAAIEYCVAACLDGEAAAMVTAPIQKSVLTEAGFGFPGHTEFLAALTGAKRAVMMLASSDIDPPLRVVPYTIHIPLAEVFRRLDPGEIAATASVILHSLRSDFGITNPRLAIAGVNPHAGEDGTMGREEIEILGPAIGALRKEGHAVLGPRSADTMFHADARRTYDAALCMFHDQALIPIKTLDFRSGVNVTLGLPIVRTSPDHGTALDIAGKGLANEASMIAAIRMAAEIADRRGL
jgi:4-hydroxythreonine-4-phosphate dehydrogenase